MFLYKSAFLIHILYIFFFPNLFLLFCLLFHFYSLSCAFLLYAFFFLQLFCFFFFLILTSLYLSVSSKFQNTKPEDLWNAIQPYTNGLPTTLSNIMDNWINTPGFPLLKVSIDRGNVVVSQNRFLLSGTPNTSQKWYVPISYTLSDDSKKFANSQTRKWLFPTEDLIIIDVISAPNSWVILNNYQVGYYRVDYDNTLWQNILKALKEPGFNNIPDLNRGQLVDDLLNLAKGNIHSFIDFLEFISFLEKDESYFAWYQAFQGINYLLPKIGEAKLQNAVLVRSSTKTANALISCF